MMADGVIFIGWTGPVRGREQSSLTVFQEALGLWGRFQAPLLASALRRQRGTNAGKKGTSARNSMLVGRRGVLGHSPNAEGLRTSCKHGGQLSAIRATT